MPDSLPQFSPVCPIPYVLQPAERVEQLRAFLKTEFGKAQRVNMEALIRLYERGELGPRKRGDPRSTLLKDTESIRTHGKMSRCLITR
ncbi:hypothetical protein N7492_010293 [Penicillium capsulatum]|uniref:Uncharacterized protein n=1 Tax=Penicillium capsulatum TaxID=69766 RepID=A0A9W9HL34_9EURO|nr:hypothetical protein N7492_010293 [Penicillium capsulatum]